MDFNQENDATPYNHDEFISVGDEFCDPWARDVGKVPRSAQKPHDRHASANATFETFINHDQRPASKGHGHMGWFDKTADQVALSTVDAQHAEEKSIHIDLRRQYSVSQEVKSEEKTSGVKVKTPSVSREEYNRHMKLISEKLSEEKLRLQKQLQQYPRLPRPPPSRPSPGTKKVASHKRMMR